jgi:hypothetical protein
MNVSTENIIKEIIKTVEENSPNHLEPDWENWFIGLTIYPNQTKNEKGKPEKWFTWNAKSASDAQEIKSFFLNNYPIKSNEAAGNFDYFIFIYK